MVDYECSKKLLYVFNFVFWLGGAVLLGFGIWMKVDPTLGNYLVVANIRGTDPILNYAAYIFIGAGGLAIIVGFLGCCGAMRGSQGLLFVYIAFLLLVMAAEIVAGVLALLYRNKIETYMRESMEDQLKYEYDVGTKEGNAWDFLQQEHKCCGGNNLTDYVQSKWWNDTRTYVNSTREMAIVPNSCCAPDDIVQCQTDARNKYTNGSSFYGEGCYESLEAWIKKHSLIMMILGLVVGGAQIFSFIAACCVRSALKKQTYEKN